jgi:hypothetical protein
MSEEFGQKALKQFNSFIEANNQKYTFDDIATIFKDLINTISMNRQKQLINCDKIEKSARFRIKDSYIRIFMAYDIKSLGRTFIGMGYNTNPDEQFVLYTTKICNDFSIEELENWYKDSILKLIKTGKALQFNYFINNQELMPNLLYNHRNNSHKYSSESWAGVTIS